MALPNLFIVGSGRSGSSMTAGLFHGIGFHQGDRLHPPTAENPKGYFEDAAVNQLNNQILYRHVPAPEVIGGISYRQDSARAGGAWLARLPLETEVAATEEEIRQIAQLTRSRPFCLKDTRFCYLLHLWRAAAPHARMICVFRPPQITAASILRSLRTRPGLFKMALSVEQALEIWTLMYRHVLERQAQSGEWFFVEYDDIVSGRALPALEAFSGTALDRTFPDRILDRTREEFDAPAEAARVYRALRERRTSL